jgi:hypothetical protein
MIVLRRRGVREWAFITAFNSHSTPIALPENERRQAALVEMVSRAGYECLTGRGVAEGGGWSEESVLVFGLARDEARRIACEFGQDAILVGACGQPAELLWCWEQADERG